ncbi:(2Fe-2S)-binding protein [Irregularibacter muris]|uniref:(2Fe-2S)-binding protein n=1 Tax=Irregularibacter muris TaxID=1796619 RepID=A0AAE3HI46_9FIRM|nr:(2Fe-2S)-binding protein [Irregularibacter muris]MCR1899359.1 (2Fe-2S)-binding protein [Irregularibacter muris]
MSKILHFYLNGNPVEVIAKPQQNLLEVLRDGLGLTSPKCGCNRGDCGSCTVILDGKAVKSCLVLALTVEGKKILTVDGLAQGKTLHPIQQAFIDYGAPQCGYCTPGMVMAATAFLLDHPETTAEEIKDALSGNLCRCAGYEKYTDALLAVSKGEYGPIPKGSDLDV